jgi:hypothetical protein
MWLYIILFLLISYIFYYKSKEGLQSGYYHADMFGSKECPRKGNCKKAEFI